MAGMSYSPRLQLLISREAIGLTVKRLAGQISRSYRSKRPVLLGVLKGAFIFMADLVRQLDFPLEVDFVTLESYRNTRSCGRVRMAQTPHLNLTGRHVLVVEDIVDTGLTTAFLLDYLKKQGPASVRVCALADKPSRRQTQVKIDYLGFTVPYKFLVGYGLDCNQKYRNLPDIRYLEEGE